MNVNEYLEQYQLELETLRRQAEVREYEYGYSGNVEAAPDPCVDCGKTVWDEFYTKVNGLELLFGPDLSDSLKREANKANQEWAQEKANAQQAAAELLLWIDFFTYMNKLGGPASLYHYILEDYWTCQHPTFNGFIKQDEKCPVCHAVYLPD
jgi:hypothetical protein